MITEEVNKLIKSGANVKVWEIIKDGNKERESLFQGIVLARKHGNEIGATFTVRAVVGGCGVEKIYPIHSPMIKKVEIISSPKKVKRSKLYFLRELSTKEIKRKLGFSS